MIETEYQKSVGYHVVRLKSSVVIPYRSVVAHADRFVNIQPQYINRTQHLGHTDDSWSGVKMFLRVVILVFAATCCTARVIGKALHTGHWYIRLGTEAGVKQAVTSWLQTIKLGDIVGTNIKRCILYFGWFPAVCILYADFRNALCSIFIVGVSRKNNRDEIVGVFTWEKLWLEISLS